MKKTNKYYSVLFTSIFIIVAILFSPKLSAQVSFWSENFEGVPCTAGCNPSVYGWTSTNTGANSTSANDWYYSCAENGQGAGVCGAGCGTDESLHIGSTTLGDIGAAFDATQTTNKRIESPTIDCSGKSTIAVNFNYITFGDAGIDFCTMMYFNGATWSSLGVMAQTTCCGGACNGFRQARWTAFNVALPASANNNANVRIGFNWTNNNVSGNDPSFAVDDISITYVTLLPISLKDFSAKDEEGVVRLEWITASETNNDFFTVERSNDAVHFEEILFHNGSGNSNEEKKYFDYDTKPLNGVSYYRLKQTDFDGKYSYSPTVVVKTDNNSDEFTVFPNPSKGEYNLFFENKDLEKMQLNVLDYTGRTILSKAINNSYLFLDLNHQPNGIYFLEVSKNGVITRKKIIKH